MNSQNVKTIVLTGGACSGKTSFLESLKEMGTEGFCGYRMLFVPEAATILASHGMRFQDGEEMFQRAILSMQRSMEAIYRRYAQERKEDICIICDRGTLDGAAYCGSETFSALCKEEETSVDELTSSYDGVIYLVSAAVGAGEHYGKESNECRRESLEEAVALEHKTYKCWKEHPNIAIIGNENGKSFEQKMEEARHALADMLAK